MENPAILLIPIVGLILGVVLAFLLLPVVLRMLVGSSRREVVAYQPSRMNLDQAYEIVNSVHYGHVRLVDSADRATYDEAMSLVRQHQGG